MDIFNNYVYLVGIKDTGKRVLDKINHNNLEWLFNRTSKYDKSVEMGSNKCSMSITRVYNHSILKYCIDDPNKIDFDIKLEDVNCVAVILVYDEEGYEDAKRFKEVINSDYILYVDICVNDSNDFNEIKAINTKEEYAKEVICDMLILTLPCPGIVAFDYADFKSFMEDGYRYGCFLTIGDYINGVTISTLGKLNNIDGIYETLTIVVGKPFSLKAIEPLLRLEYNSTLSYCYGDDSMKNYRILVIYKLKGKMGKIIN